MAAVLGTAASAIQVADAGFKLYGALSNYIRDYVHANKNARHLADEVRTTSWALQQLGALLQQDEEAKLCKPEVITETDAALKGCQSAFDEVRLILDEFMPDNEVGIVGSRQRLKWPLKKDKVVLLLAQLERLKTTLLLVFKVLSYASRLATKPTQPLIDEKLQLAYLVKAKQDAEAQERNLLGQRTSLPDGLLSTSNHSYVLMQHKPTDQVDSSTVDRGLHDSSNSGAQDSLPGATLTDQASNYTASQGHHYSSKGKVRVAHHGINSFFVVPTAIPPVLTRPPAPLPRELSETSTTTQYPQQKLSARQRMLKTQLDICTVAVARLSLALDQAKDELQQQGSLPITEISRALRLAKRTCDDLSTTERDADSADEADYSNASTSSRIDPFLWQRAVGGLAGHSIGASRLDEVHEKGDGRKLGLPVEHNPGAKVELSTAIRHARRTPRTPVGALFGHLGRLSSIMGRQKPGSAPASMEVDRYERLEHAGPEYRVVAELPADPPRAKVPLATTPSTEPPRTQKTSTSTTPALLEENTDPAPVRRKNQLARPRRGKGSERAKKPLFPSPRQGPIRLRSDSDTPIVPREVIVHSGWEEDSETPEDGGVKPKVESAYDDQGVDGDHHEQILPVTAAKNMKIEKISLGDILDDQSVRQWADETEEEEGKESAISVSLPAAVTHELNYIRKEDDNKDDDEEEVEDAVEQLLRRWTKLAI
ncbi:hypothetical protein LTR62_004846 [Meristemomyces frigidus]|uniref:Fungal N-terminal domain-containing protein n=1 Tax=Meristemomyces frigidus TaxID=1508187 RepID=A0AAN7TFZ1_9PEZI|nr:hypothetical protein LTR62_004846 [Meristemomyces frigidus]